MTTNTPTPAPDLDARVAALMDKADRFADERGESKRPVDSQIYRNYLEQAIRAELQKPALQVNAAAVESDWKAEFERERTKFQQETRRTSAQAVLLLKWFQRARDKGCFAEKWTKACYDCELMLETKDLLESPINAEPPLPARAQKVTTIQSTGLVDCGECRTQRCPAGNCRNAIPPNAPQGDEVSDAERLEFMANSPARYIEKYERMWRVYQDRALPTMASADWMAMTVEYWTTPREAIDAAIRAAQKG